MSKSIIDREALNKANSELDRLIKEAESMGLEINSEPTMRYVFDGRDAWKYALKTTIGSSILLPTTGFAYVNFGDLVSGTKYKVRD